MGKILSFSVIFSWLSCHTTYAQHVMPFVYTAKYTETPINVDGKIDEPIWNLTSWSTSFVDIEGDATNPPDFDTKVKMVYDSTYLYIAAKLSEPHVWGYLNKINKPIYRYDNDFEVFVDPDDDHCNYYELELNALNTTWQLSLPFPYRNGGSANDPDMMTGMKSAVYVEGTLNNPNDLDKYWSVEIALPFSGFKKYNTSGEIPTPGTSWRINFSRVQWEHKVSDNRYIKSPGKPESNWVWSPQFEINMHAPERWGYLFFEYNEDKKNLESTWILEKELLEVKKSIEQEGKRVFPKYDDLSLIKMGNLFILKLKDKQKKVSYYLNNRTCLWKSDE